MSPSAPSPTPFEKMLAEARQALELPTGSEEHLLVRESDSLPSCFAVSDLAAASVAAAGLAASELLALEGEPPPVVVDRHLASAWFLWSLRPQGWKPPGPWDPIAGDYPTEDGWIRLHTSAQRHREAALAVLGCAGEREPVAAAVARCQAGELEAAIAAAGGCAAEMRSVGAWREREQGRAVAAEPLIALRRMPAPAPRPWRPEPGRPLAGVRVLDLTRILAGPIATRFLAGLGADVLRIDPPGWDEPSVAPDVTLGKSCARLDLRRADDRRVFEALLAEADVLVHGYRPGAMEGLGYDEAQRRAINPGLVDVSLCAYGWSGPWAERRGFDSLVQMSAGIAEAGMRWKQADKPVPLPVQALDHATGYLMAAAALRGLIARQREGETIAARLSLARTAALLVEAGEALAGPAFGGMQEQDYNAEVEDTAWGPAQRLRSPILIGGNPLRWVLPASPLGSATAAWRA